MVVDHYKKYGKKYYESHKERELKRAKDRYATVGKPESSKLYYMTYRYGLTLEDYEALLAAQNNCCAICGVNAKTKTKRLDIDHCHDKKIIRGLLCNNCNRGLGHFKDSVEYLKNAIKYMEERADGTITERGGVCGS